MGGGRNDENTIQSISVNVKTGRRKKSKASKAKITVACK